MKTEQRNHIILELERGMQSCFAPVFSKGIEVQAALNVSIRELLCNQLGIAESYLENGIQTIFLDGKLVDDYDTAIVGHGSMLALSAAMPGLVGAILRRGGPLAAMRREITHNGGQSPAFDPQGSVTIKLFNLTARDIGPLLLNYGIGISSDDLGHLLTMFAGGFRRGCRRATLDGSGITLDRLAATVEKSERIYLQNKAI